MKTAFASATKGAMGAKLALAAVVVGAAEAAKALYEVGEEFDHAYKKIQANTGATGKELQRLKGDFKDVLVHVPASFEETATAIGELHKRLGLIGKPLQHESRQFLELSRMLGGDLEGNIKAVARAFEDWNVTVSDQPKVLDELFRASQKTGIAVEDLAEQVDKFGAPLRNLHIGLPKAIAMFASFEKAGVANTKVGMALNMAFKTLVNEGLDPKKTGGAVMRLFQGIEDGSVTAKRALEVFGSKGGGALIQAAKQGRFHFGAFMDEMHKGKGTIISTGEQTKTTSDRFHELGNKIKVLVAPAAEFLYNQIGKLAEALNKLSFKKIMHELGLSKGDLHGLGNAVKAVGGIFGEVFGKTIKRAVEGAVQQLKGSVGSIKGAVNLIGDVIHGRFKNIWGDVKDIFRSGIDVTVGFLKASTAQFGGATGKIAKILTGTWIFDTWGTIKGVFKSGVNDVIGFLNLLIDAIDHIPGVDIGHIGGIGGGGPSFSSPKEKKEAVHHQHRYSGGAITRPTAIVGEEAPQHPEMVIAYNPAYRKKNLVHWAEAGKALGVPGFGLGGAITGAASSAASSVGGAVTGAFNTAAGAIGGLPTPHLPKWLSGLGSYILNQVTEWIKSGFQSHKLGHLVGGTQGPKGVGSFMGVPMANWVIQSLQFAQSKGVRVRPTSGYRSHAQNVSEGRTYFSEHEKTQYPGGAVDFGGYVDPAAYAMKMGVVHATSGFKYPLLAPIGFRDDGHASGTGHFRGGLLRRFAKGGLIRGKVSYFGGGTEASGMNTSQPGMALNLNPGTESGWDNPTTRGWIAAASAGHPVFGKVTIAGHTANLPVTDLGPAGFTGRAIDITEGGVRKLGLSTSSFPTDSIGTVSILGAGGGGAAKHQAAPPAKPEMGLSGHQVAAVQRVGPRQRVPVYHKRMGIGRAAPAIAPGETEAVEDPAVAAMEALTAAIQEQKQAEEELTKSINDQNAIASSEMAISGATARRALADIIAGNLGARTQHRAALAGAGSVGTM